MKKIKDLDACDVDKLCKQLQRGPKKRGKNFTDGDPQLKMPWYMTTNKKGREKI